MAQSWACLPDRMYSCESLSHLPRMIFDELWHVFQGVARNFSNSDNPHTLCRMSEFMENLCRDS